MFLKLLDIKEKVRQNPTDNYVGALFIPCQKPIDKYKEILLWEWHVHLWHAVILMPLMTFPCIRDIHEIIFLNKSQKKEYSIPLEERKYTICQTTNPLHYQVVNALLLPQWWHIKTTELCRSIAAKLSERVQFVPISVITEYGGQ